MVLAPDGKIVQDLMDRVENKEEVQAYIDESVKKSDMDRTQLNKTKSGCPLQGVYAINPVNGKEVPVFIGDFVLASYGTGAVMASLASSTVRPVNSSELISLQPLPR